MKQDVFVNLSRGDEYLLHTIRDKEYSFTKRVAIPHELFKKYKRVMHELNQINKELAEIYNANNKGESNG